MAWPDNFLGSRIEACASYLPMKTPPTPADPHIAWCPLGVRSPSSRSRSKPAPRERQYVLSSFDKIEIAERQNGPDLSGAPERVTAELGRRSSNSQTDSLSIPRPVSGKLLARYQWQES
jgi:hypothetical protein